MNKTTKAEFLKMSQTERLNFVQSKAAEPVKKPPRQKKKVTLKGLAAEIIGTFNNERKRDIITQIQQTTGVNEKRAQNGFNLMLEGGYIAHGINDRYYLAGSVPF